MIAVMRELETDRAVDVAAFLSAGAVAAGVGLARRCQGSRDGEGASGISQGCRTHIKCIDISCEDDVGCRP